MTGATLIIVPEYHAIRFALGLSELLLGIYLSRRYVPKPLFSLTCFLLLSACTDHLPPAFIWSHGWWTHFWSPLMALRLVVIMWVTVALLLDAMSTLNDRARAILLVWSWCSTMALILIAYQVDIEKQNWFQSLALIRQFVLMLLFGLTSWCWAYLTWHTPVQIRRPVKQVGVLWCGWLLLTFLLSTTTSHGLLWVLVPWKGGEWWWRVVSDCCTVGQVLVVGGWWLIAHRIPAARESRVSTLPPTIAGSLRSRATI